MKNTLLTLFACVASIALWAVPATPRGIPITQPDGTVKTVFLHGDEYFHFMTDENGNWLNHLDDGTLVSVPALTPQEIADRRAASPLRMRQQTTTATPLNIAPRGLVVLVNFTDKAFKNTAEDIDSMLNGEQYYRDFDYRYYGTKYHLYCEGSARHYFMDQSYGQYAPVFDVVGPINLPHELSYYGKNNDAKAHEMIISACQKAASEQGVDMSLYDNNNDGYLDFVYVFYAGFGEADSGMEKTVWPHSSDLSMLQVKAGGKYIGKYACSSEITYSTHELTGLGTFCHEFSHVLGLLDHYDTQYHGFKTPGSWDVMDNGSHNNEGYTPPAYSSFERFFLGWLTPTILSSPQTVTMLRVQQKAGALISATGTHNLIGNDPNPDSFYMVENRQQKKWDQYLPWHGMMLTKIQYDYYIWMRNEVNCNEQNMGVHVIEADGIRPTQPTTEEELDNGYYGKPGDMFPVGADSYTPYATYPITNIVETDSLITFDFMGGGEVVLLGDETVDEIQEEHPEPQPKGLPSVKTTGMAVTGIYDMLGQKMQTNDVRLLPHGVYILRTEKTSYKISIP